MLRNGEGVWLLLRYTAAHPVGEGKGDSGVSDEEGEGVAATRQGWV